MLHHAGGNIFYHSGYNNLGRSVIRNYDDDREIVLKIHKIGAIKLYWRMRVQQSSNQNFVHIQKKLLSYSIMHLQNDESSIISIPDISIGSLDICDQPTKVQIIWISYCCKHDIYEKNVIIYHWGQTGIRILVLCCHPILAEYVDASKCFWSMSYCLWPLCLRCQDATVHQN